MKVHSNSRDTGALRWQQRGVEQVRQAWRHLRRLQTLDRHPMALALIPIQAMQPRFARLPHRRSWRD